MAVKASAVITLSTIRDISSVTWYYQLKTGTTAPSKPTASPPPSPWTTNEPSYTAGDTKYLFVVERTIYTDGTFEYTDPSLSSSYEAAKLAYNESQNAKKVATNFLAELSNGVFTHASGTPADPTDSSARGVKITDIIEIIRNGLSVAQFGENAVIGSTDNSKLNILLEPDDEDGGGRFMFRQGTNEDFGIIVSGNQMDILGGTTQVSNDVRVTNDDILLRSEDDLNSMMYKNKGLVEVGPDSIYLHLFGKTATRASIEAFLSSDYLKGYITVSADNWRVNSSGAFVAKGMIGMIQMFGGSTAPAGWLLCQGQAISRTTYADLFSVIGTTWGSGNGSSTFNVPDLRGRAPIGAGTGSGLTARTLGAQNIGSENAIVPYHRHSVAKVSGGIPSTGSSHGHNVYYRNDNNISGSGSADRLGTSSTYAGTRAAVPSGGSHTHDLPAHNTEYAGTSGNTTGANMQPSAVVNFIICTGVL